ncbi:MAG: hypothetical protein SNJ77_04335 [Cytophagales bacterium]
MSFNKLSKYNFDYITLEEVLVLELLIFHYQKNTLNNLVATRMADETGLKKNKVQIALQELEEKKFISKEVLEFRTVYMLNMSKVVDSLNLIFKKEYRNIFRIYHKINMPEAFKNTAQKQRKNRKDLLTKNKTANKNKQPQAVQISLFDI